jgi:hypothetical protein
VLRLSREDDQLLQPMGNFEIPAATKEIQVSAQVSSDEEDSQLIGDLAFFWNRAPDEDLPPPDQGASQAIIFPEI